MPILDAIDEALRQSPGLQEALAHVASILRAGVPAYTWVGIYLVEDQDLVLHAWAGDQPTEHSRIPLAEGVCGFAATSAQTIVVPDVTKDERYLMCFPTTKSEAVVPVLKDDRVVGEIDVDSDEPDAFSRSDVVLLEDVAARVAAIL